MTPYEDGEKTAKLEEAISLGFILRLQDPDGWIRYRLTDRGLQQWAFERFIVGKR